MPADIGRRLDPAAHWIGWSARGWEWLRGLPEDATGDAAAEALELAIAWCGDRTLDVGHLSAAPRLTFVCVDDAGIVTCEPRPGCAAPDWGWLCEPGRVEMSRADMLGELERFGRALLAEMAARIDAIAAGALATRAVVNLEALHQEHAARERQLRAALAREPDVAEDWERIERALRVVDRAIGAGV